MNVVKVLVLAGLLAIRGFAADSYGISDTVMGQFEGFWTAKSGAKGRVVAQIRPLANNQYDGFVLLMRARAPVAAFSLKAATAEKTGIKFSGNTSGKDSQADLLAQTEAQCELVKDALKGKFSGDLGEGTFEAQRVVHTPQTLGKAAPKHAIVLLDETGPKNWENFDWPVQKDGVIQVGKGNIKTKEELNNFHLHLEFRTPYMPIEQGQARGNSGVYLQGKYEVQVLDSFGLYPLQDNDCGGIYKVRAPHLNACLPPMSWQTYDITYVEGHDGIPTITVVQNGVTVIQKAKVPAGLKESGTGGGDPESGFLMLQNHGNPVQFRNIWAEPIFSEAKKH